MKKLVLIFGLIKLFILTTIAQNAVVSAEKMNVFYIGVNNPISIAVPNVPSDKLIVKGENVENINDLGNGKYDVRVNRAGEVTIIVEANGQITKKKFRAKQMPDPIIVVLGLRNGFEHTGSINVQNFRFVSGLVSVMEGFDFDARCSIQSYQVIISPKRGEVFKTTVIGSTFSEEVQKRFQALEIGDTVSFLEIKTRCPGDPVARNAGLLSYIMK